MDWGAVGDWIGKIEPGAWSEWVASILTAGSLLLGFSILRRDRVKDKREQALRILTWITQEGAECEIHVRNTSDQPIFGVTLITRPRAPWIRPIWHRLLRIGKKPLRYRLLQYKQYKDLSLEAGATWSVRWPFPKPEAALHRTILRFKDAAGVMHNRDVSLGRDPRFLGLPGRLSEGHILLTLAPIMASYYAESRIPLPKPEEGYTWIVGKNTIKALNAENERIPESEFLDESTHSQDSKDIDPKNEPLNDRETEQKQ